MTATHHDLRRPKPETTSLDWTYLDGLVKSITSRDISVSTKFSIYVTRTLFALSEDEAAETITDGSNDRGIDAALIDTQNRDVHLFQFKYREASDHISKQFPGNCVDKLLSFTDDLLRHDQRMLDGCNRLLQIKVSQIWDLVAEGPVQIHIHLASNARKLEQKDHARLNAGLKKYGANLWEYSAPDLIVTRHHGRKNRRKIQFNAGRLEYTSDGKRMISGVVDLKELAQMLNHPDSESQLDHTLFLDNVRGALGMDNDVNKSIERTLFTQAATNFVFFNNGITIVADQILYQAAGNFPVEMINPQIVNGCQTASIVHQAFQIDQFIGSRNETPPSVQIRVIESSDFKFRQDVAISTNSQTRIYGRDLRAVDQTQIKIERALSSSGYCYLRKRSDVSDMPAGQTIDMARLGQIILAYYRKQPETAKTSNAIFGDLYEDVFDLSFLTVDKIVAVHILHRLIEDRRQLARQKLRSADRQPYREEWILEGHLHVLYVLGLLCDRDGAELADVKSAALRIKEAIEIVGEFVARHSTVAAYRLFRTTGTSSQLAKLVAQTKRQVKGLPQGDLFGPMAI